jgi:hypothetical protein
MMPTRQQRQRWRASTRATISTLYPQYKIEISDRYAKDAQRRHPHLPIPQERATESKGSNDKTKQRNGDNRIECPQNSEIENKGRKV